MDQILVLSSMTDLVYDKRKEGWKLLQDAPFTGSSILELVEFCRGKQGINGKTMLARTKKLGCAAG